MLHTTTTQFAWSIPAYEKPVRSVDWFWALGIAVITGAVLAIIAKNFLFAFLVVMGGILIVAYGRKEPDIMNIEISNHGISINKNIFHYEMIKGFWMYTDHKSRPRLIINVSRTLLPKITLPLPMDMDYITLHEFLISRIPETEMYESRIDLIAERFDL